MIGISAGLASRRRFLLFQSAKVYNTLTGHTWHFRVHCQAFELE